MFSGRNVREERAGLGIGTVLFLHISSYSSKFNNLVCGMGLGVQECTLYMKRWGTEPIGVC